jgi:hypothetical protein
MLGIRWNGAIVQSDTASCLAAAAPWAALPDGGSAPLKVLAKAKRCAPPEASPTTSSLHGRLGVAGAGAR